MRRFPSSATPLSIFAVPVALIALAMPASANAALASGGEGAATRGASEPEAPSTLEDFGANFNADVTGRIKSGISATPLAAYDPTYGLIIGGAVFGGNGEGRFPRRYSLAAFVTTGGNFGFDYHVKRWFGGRWFYTGHAAANNLYVAYYGEGDRTSIDDRVDIGTRWASVTPAIGYRFTRRLSAALFPEFSYRAETDVGGDPTRRLFGRDFTPAFGTSVTWDARDSEVDPVRGRYLGAMFRWGPGALSNRVGAVDFAQLTADARAYFPVSDTSTIAVQALGGTGRGDPGFLYRFSFGSDRVLRGYKGDRFRGDHYYALQSEWRQNLTKTFSYAVFGAFGDIADRSFSDFGSPKWAFGPGLRYALPPDRVAKLRLDAGFGRGEWAFYLNFNEAY